MNLEMQLALARNQNTPSDILNDLSTSSFDEVRIAVAANTNTDTATLITFAQKENVVSKLHKLLFKYMSDQNYSVRALVARNPYAPYEILSKLSNDESQYVRSAVADNLNTPIDILNTLNKDRAWSVRESVARNPNTSVDRSTACLVSMENMVAVSS